MILNFLFVAGLGLASAVPMSRRDAVDSAIENIGWHYNDKLCLDLLMVDCSKHTTVHDEKVCGSDGVTYDNHCKYVHAYCQFVYSANHLGVASHGACPLTTPAPATTAPPATAAPVGTTLPPAGGSTQPPVATSPGQVMTSGAPVVTTGAPVVLTSTTAAPTTSNPNHHIIQNVFCMNAAGISCAASGVDVICGTNGVLYPNQCEFAKAHCKIPNLSHDDPANCASPGK